MKANFVGVNNMEKESFGVVMVNCWKKENGEEEDETVDEDFMKDWEEN